jgi:c-di-GMP-binding flagellar brake protein YcgR
MGDDEKRRHHRFLALLEMKVRAGDGIPSDLKLTTIDVSTGGARCASNRPIESDVTLRVTLSLVGGDLRAPEVVDIDATVLRCTDQPGARSDRRYEIILRFSGMEAADRKKLQSYLNSL